jgi:hypothetical protein
MPHLVSLAELLADTGVDNGATPLFDKDSLSVEAGPTAQQVVIHAGSGAAVRKHVAELNPTHPEVTYPAPKKGEPGDVNTDYPLPSRGVSPGEGPAQKTTAAQRERKQQTAEASPTGRAESKTGKPDAAKAPKK